MVAFLGQQQQQQQQVESIFKKICLHAARFEFMALDAICQQQREERETVSQKEREREKKGDIQALPSFFLLFALLINSPHYRSEIAKVNRHIDRQSVPWRLIENTLSISTVLSVVLFRGCGRCYRLSRTTSLSYRSYRFCNKTTGINNIFSWISIYFLWFALALVIP